MRPVACFRKAFLLRAMTDATRTQLRAQQDEQQTRSFMRWWNTHLAEAKPPIHINDLIEEIKPGVASIKLLEVLSDSSCGKFNKKPLSKYQYFENHNIFLKQLKSQGIKIVSVSPVA